MRSNIVITNYYRNFNCKSGRTTSGCAVISSLKTIIETPSAKMIALLLLDAQYTTIKNITEIPTAKVAELLLDAQ